MRIWSILWEVLGFPGSQQGNRCRPNQSHGHSNYETSSHGKRTKEHLGKSLVYLEIHPWAGINHVGFHQVAQERAKFWIGRSAAIGLQEAAANHDGPPHDANPIHKKPLLHYMATNLYAIGALIAQKDEGGVEQPVYYISCALKDVETHYPRAERACLAILYASQRFAPLFLGLRSTADDQVPCH